MVTQLDALREQIAQTRDIATLRSLRDRIHEESAAMLDSPMPAEWNEWINGVHDSFIRIAVEEAVKEMSDSEWGAPPVPFAMLLFGSGGRREQTLWSDQDNGLIYADPEPEREEAVRNYFRELGERVVGLLFRLGYPPCEGKVMCSEPMWCQSEAGWNGTLDGWMADPSWENMRYMLIVADMRAIAGESSLVERVRTRMLVRIAEDRQVMESLLHNTLRRKVSLGVLGNLIPERFGEDMGGIDIKYGAYIPLVNGIRMLALLYGLPQSGTLDRIAGMEEKKLEEEKWTSEWRQAFLSVIRLRSLVSYKLEEQYYQTSGVLPGAMLTKNRKQELKAVLRTGQKLHKYVEKKIHALGGKPGV